MDIISVLDARLTAVVVQYLKYSGSSFSDARVALDVRQDRLPNLEVMGRWRRRMPRALCFSLGSEGRASVDWAPQEEKRRSNNYERAGGNKKNPVFVSWDAQSFIFRCVWRDK